MSAKIRPISRDHHLRRTRSAGARVYSAVNIAFFVVFSLACLFPFYYLFINTISDNALVSRGVINFFPRGVNIKNYLALRDVNDLGNAFLVSVARTVIGTLLMSMASGFVGYLVTQQKLWARGVWYRFLVITMYFNAGLIPSYLNMVMLGLVDTFYAYIIPGIVAPFNIILTKTYIESIPGELEESALIDGAGYLMIFRKIILPLCVPILATVSIFGAVGHWNSFTDSLIYMQNAPRLYTLQHRLYIYLNTATNLDALLQGGGSSAVAQQAMQNAFNAKVIKYTISMVTIIPILLVYPFMTRYFQKGIMLGAVKG